MGARSSIAHAIHAVAHWIGGNAAEVSVPPTPQGQEEPQIGGAAGEGAEGTRGLLQGLAKTALSRTGCAAIALIVLFVVALVVWVGDHRGTWVVRDFEVGDTQSSGVDGQRAAISLAAELGRIGTGKPIPTFTIFQLAPPNARSGSVQDQKGVSLDDCLSIMQGPGSFASAQNKNIPLQRRRVGSSENALDLGRFSLGSLSVPSELITQPMLRLFAGGYREFSGRITESQGDLHIIVELRAPPTGWSVAGPRDALPEMMEYLALRIALDLDPGYLLTAGFTSSPSDTDLAFNMGVEQFQLRNYERAAAFLGIADRFAPLRADVDAMLGLALYHRAFSGAGQDPGLIQTATSHIEDSVSEDTAGEGSLFRPYLMCAYQGLGKTTDAERELAILNGYLKARERRGSEVRMEALDMLPLGGPNRHVADSDDLVAFVGSDGSIVGVSKQTGDATTLVPAVGKGPREILFVDGTTLAIVAPDGEVLAVEGVSGESGQTRVVVPGPRLGGVQQLAVSGSRFDWLNVFMLNRLGEVYWCKTDRTMSSCEPGSRLSPTMGNVRQLFAVDDTLVLLAEDSSVWSADMTEAGRLTDPARLTAPPRDEEVREVALSENGTLYLLVANGNLWRYLDDGFAGTEKLSLVDEGTSTVQIFSAGGVVFLLKGDGEIWRLTDPSGGSSPVLSKVESSGLTGPIQELYVQVSGSGSRSLFGLTADRSLLEGVDTGGNTITFSLLGVRPPGTQEPGQIQVPTEAPTASPTAVPFVERLIYTTAFTTGNNEIMSAALDGSDARRLTTTKTSEQEPSLCAENQKIAFVSVEHTGGGDVSSLWVMDSDGGNPAALDAEGGALYQGPTWSKGCRYLAYAKRTPQAGTWRLYVVDFGLQYQPHFPLVEGRYPSWWQAGDVLRLLYTTRGNFIAALDIQSCITTPAVESSPCEGSLFLDTPIAGAQPAISPDGTLLVYTSVPGPGESTGTFDQDLYLYRVIEGGDPIRLTVDEPFKDGSFPQDWYPTWSLDGTRIYFESTRSGNSDIWEIRPDGSSLTQVTHGPRDEERPMVGLQDMSAIRSQ